jgi:phosphatidylglycerol:prolipoprotein diacylglycerol transferase
VYFPSTVAFYIGTWPVRWYGIAYGLGLMLTTLYAEWCVRRDYCAAVGVQHLNRLFHYATLGVVLGARIGHFVLYDRHTLLHDPLDVVRVWDGGMSFHGGLVGLCCAVAVYAYRYGVNGWVISDLFACSVPIGLGIGRIGNFINQELYGRPTQCPWGIVFPGVDAVPRHPSQLYEAVLEGVILFMVLRWCMVRYGRTWPAGRLSALFCMAYGVLRWTSEWFRVPDDGMIGPLTWGQMYTIPVILGGCIVWWRTGRGTSRRLHV